jgi:hypothetical protein
MGRVVLKALLWRPLRRRPWRFLVTVLGVATGVAAVVATVASSRAAVRAFAEGVEEVAGAIRVEVTRPGGLPASLLGALRPLAGDAVVVPVVEEVARLVELGDGVRVLGVDLLVDAQVRPVLETNRPPSRSSPRSPAVASSCPTRSRGGSAWRWATPSPCRPGHGSSRSRWWRCSRPSGWQRRDGGGGDGRRARRRAVRPR